MRKLKLFFACLLMAVLSIGQVWAGTATATLQISSGVTADGDLTDDASNTWAVSSDGSYTSNSSYIQCGTNKANVSYIRLTTSAFSSKKITKVQVWGTSKANTSVSAKVIIGSVTIGTSSEYTSQTASSGGTEFSVDNTDEETGDLTIEISRASAATGAIYFNKAIVTYEDGGDPDPVLESITIDGTLDKDTYEEGELFDPTGLVAIGHYDDSNTADLTSSVEWAYTPSGALTLGTTSVNVTATLGTIVGNTDVDITVNEHVVTPGEYEVLLSNTLWGVSSGQQAAGVTSMSGSSHDISFTTTKGSSQMYASGTQTRFYSSSTLTISVPAGYAITSVVFAEPTSDKKWDGSISVDNGEYTTGTKTWEGEENSVTFTFGAQNRAATATVTYKVATADAPSVTINPTEISLDAPDAASGTIDATYTNITLASVTIGRFNDAECTEEFTGEWLTATLNGDKDIEYTIAANTGAARTAYIKLTAPASNGTSPDVVKVIAVSQAQAIPTYTALDAIFAAATSTNTTVNVVFNNWVISAVNGDNAYLTDGTYGLIIYTSGHGFSVGNVLSGTVQTTLVLYKGSAELKGVTSTSEGLTVTTGGTITPREVSDPTTLTGAHTGSVITVSGSCTEPNTGTYLVNGVQLYNSLFTFDALTAGNQYTCTGVFVMFNTTKEILPRNAADIEEVAVPTAIITLADVVLEKGQNTTLAATVAPAVAASAEVGYSILDGDSYVSLAGAVLTADEVGTAHIRATVADNLPNYKGATKDITVTVNPVDSRKTAQDIDGFEAISGALNADISFEAKKGNANNTPIVPSGKDYIRIYQNGGYLAVNAVKGCTIDEVIITIPSGCNSTTIAVGTDEDNLPTTGGSAATAGSSFTTGTGLNSQNVYLVCLGTTSSTRLEFGTIVVKYTGEPATVTGLALGGTYQTEFEVDDTFNHTGIVVTATYSDASEEDVTALANFSTPDMSAAGTKEITVSFGGQSTSYNIEVVAATLDHIELSGDYPTSFAQGASFSHAGMTVTAVYSDYSEVDVTADATFSGYSMSGAGVQTVTVAYGGKEATYKITVVPANTDVITASGIGAEGSSYADWSAKSFNTSAVYAGHSYAPNTDAIQIRTSQSKEGIVVTTQNETKVVKSVVVNFATEPTNSRVLQVYGKHSVYTSAADLFDTEKQGTLIGTLAASGTLDCTAADYEFIGLRSSDGAMYLACVMVTWGDATPEPDYTEVRSGLEPGRYYTVCLPRKVVAVKGATFWTLEKKNMEGSQAYLEEETNNLPFAAGKPFIIQATANKLEVAYEGDATTTAGVNGAIHGTLTYMDADALDAAGPNVYLLYQNELRPLGENNHLDANRAYVKINELDAVPEAPQNAPGRRVVAMPMEKDVTTDINALNAAEAPVKMIIDGNLFILRGEKLYDATGRLVK